MLGGGQGVTPKGSHGAGPKGAGNCHSYRPLARRRAPRAVSTSRLHSAHVSCCVSSHKDISPTGLKLSLAALIEAGYSCADGFWPGIGFRGMTFNPTQVSSRDVWGRVGTVSGGVKCWPWERRMLGMGLCSSGWSSSSLKRRAAEGFFLFPRLGVEGPWIGWAKEPDNLERSRV